MRIQAKYRHDLLNNKRVNEFSIIAELSYCIVICTYHSNEIRSNHGDKMRYLLVLPCAFLTFPTCLSTYLYAVIRLVPLLTYIVHTTCKYTA